jgi:hypothetical protein
MDRHSRHAPPARKIIILAFAILIVASFFLLARLFLSPGRVSASDLDSPPCTNYIGNCPTPTTPDPTQCTNYNGNCPTPTPTRPPTPTATPVNIASQPTPTPTSCPPAGPQCTGLDPNLLQDPQGCPVIGSELNMLYGISSVPIVYNGHVMGRADERYSSNCNSWWVRAFVYDGTGVHFHGVAPITLVNRDYHGYIPNSYSTGYYESWTSMVFADPNNGGFAPQAFTVTITIQVGDNNGPLITTILPMKPVP